MACAFSQRPRTVFKKSCITIVSSVFIVLMFRIIPCSLAVELMMCLSFVDAGSSVGGLSALLLVLLFFGFCLSLLSSSSNRFRSGCDSSA